MLGPGRVIDGRYTLLRRLEGGGMGEVWVARESDARDIAIKFILAGRRDPELIERFSVEVRTAARLRSPHVVGVHHWGTHDGSPYMVMELLKGSDLARHLHVHGKIAEVRTAVDYVVQACEAVVVAHAEGVIHRDLKPANLFLDEQTRQIKVLDFGVAKATQSTRSELTKDGRYVGTLAYSPPEQLADAAGVTARSDIWSIGAILYELLSGTPAFPESYPEVILAIAQREPRPLSELRRDVPAGLSNCVARCLAKDPEQRFEDVESLIRALAEFGGRESLAIAGRLPNASDHAGSGPSSDAIPEFHSEDDLVEAVHSVRLAPDGSTRRVVFMLGAGFSMPAPRRRGVPGTKEIVSLIEKQLPQRDRKQLLQKLSVSRNRYQDAFEMLASTHTADAANRVIREAVLRAYREPREALPASSLDQQKKCKEYEEAIEAWEMPDGVEHLGQIIARGLGRTASTPAARASWERFSQFHLTTNFDPLLAIGIRKHHGVCVPFVIDKDFPAPEPQSGFCTVLHLHGRWNKGDTLHNNLSARREQLERSLGEHLERSVLVVLGYGGWDDVFTRTLKQVARGSSAVDVLWTSFLNDPLEIWSQQQELITQLRHLGPRIQFYRGVDTNRFFRRLAARLDEASRTVDTDAPISTEVTQPPLAKRRRVRWWAAAAIAASTSLVGAWTAHHEWAPAPIPIREAPAAEPEPVREPPAGPEPAPPLLARVPTPAPPVLGIRCDAPLPQGHIRVGGDAIAIQDFCPDPARPLREHTAHLLLSHPSLVSAAPTLESSNPFYSLERTSQDGAVDIHLMKHAKARVIVKLQGRECSRVRRLTASAKGVSAASAVEPPKATPPPADAPCEAKLDLPAELFLERLNLELEPSTFVAKSPRFDAATLDTTVSRRPPPIPEDCLPPRHCAE